MSTISTDSEDLNATSGESHIPVGEGGDAVGRIETRGVDYIPHVERNSAPRTVVWAFEGPQFSLGTYIYGGAMVAAGLSWWACCGSPAGVIDRLAAFDDAGAERVYLQLFDLTDLDQLQLFAEDVLPHFANDEVRSQP
ncbi:MAG: F420-dependent oxidoreductase [Mycobacterium sp.]|nr:F420-dependent oxidoreductase [Mycobacterium sp.]